MIVSADPVYCHFWEHFQPASCTVMGGILHSNFSERVLPKYLGGVYLKLAATALSLTGGVYPSGVPSLRALMLQI
jgi:hypothetical protein